MVKCPQCNNEIETHIKAIYREEGSMIIARRKYICDCGKQFITSSTYLGIGDEAVEEEKKGKKKCISKK